MCGDGFGDALRRQAACRAGFIGGIIQFVQHLMQFDSQQCPMRQRQIFIA